MLLRCLILAFTGDKAASVLEDVPKELPEQAERIAAAAAMQTLDWGIGAGWQLVISGSGF